jgi:hypothetical protein
MDPYNAEDIDEYGDSDFLAQHDHTINDFRMSEKETKRKIIEKMLTLKHNMKYNKHLQSVYLKAKDLFDKMVEEHRSQLYYLDEIYRHLNTLIRENLSNNKIMSELIKDKNRIGILLKKMRKSFDKLTDVDTIIGITIEKINEITFMDEDLEYRSDEEDNDYNEYNNPENENEDDDDDDSEVNDYDNDDEAEEDYDDSEMTDDEDEDSEMTDGAEDDEDEDSEVTDGAEDDEDEDSEVTDGAEDDEDEDSEVTDGAEDDEDEDSEVTDGAEDDEDDDVIYVF